MYYSDKPIICCRSGWA